MSNLLDTQFGHLMSLYVRAAKKHIGEGNIPGPTIAGVYIDNVALLAYVTETVTEMEESEFPAYVAIDLEGLKMSSYDQGREETITKAIELLEAYLEVPTS